MKITRQQQALLDYIEVHFQTRGSAPSQREIQEKFGFSSRNAVPKHLAALEKKGLLVRNSGQARSLVLATSTVNSSDFLKVPLLGAIPAGYAEAIEETPERFLSLDPATLELSPKAKVFALKVHGDSMIHAGIVEGDLVILEQTQARPGEIVAALIDGESTLKRLILEQGELFLKAENPLYPNLIPSRELLIQGVFRALIRIPKKRL